MQQIFTDDFNARFAREKVNFPFRMYECKHTNADEDEKEVLRYGTVLSDTCFEINGQTSLVFSQTLVV